MQESEIHLDARQRLLRERNTQRRCRLGFLRRRSTEHESQPSHTVLRHVYKSQTPDTNRELFLLERQPLTPQCVSGATPRRAAECQRGLGYAFLHCRQARSCHYYLTLITKLRIQHEFPN